MDEYALAPQQPQGQPTMTMEEFMAWQEEQARKKQEQEGGMLRSLINYRKPRSYVPPATQGMPMPTIGVRG